MKILNICLGAPYTQGYTYQDNLLPHNQKILGHDVMILTGTKTRDTDGRIIEASPGSCVQNDGIKIVRIKQPKGLLRLFKVNHELEENIRTFDPDFIFVHGMVSMVPKAVIKFIKQHPEVHAVVDNHQDTYNTDFRRCSIRIYHLFYKLFWKRWIHYFSMVYGTTSWRKDFAHKILGIPYAKLDTLVMGIDPTLLKQCHSGIREEIRNKLDLGKEVFVFIHGGKISENKKTLEVVKAFKQLQSQDIRLLLFGPIDTNYKEKLITDINIDSRIIYLGPLKSSEICKYFFASDFGVFPGGHSVLWEEAAGCALPCVYREYSASCHLSIHDNCFFIKDEEVSQKLTEVLNDVYMDQKLYMKLKKNAYNVSDNFNYSTIAEKSLEFAE